MPTLLPLFATLALAQDPLYDPIVYPPDVLPDDPVTSAEVRVEGGGALVLRHTDVVVEVHAGVARTTMVQLFQNPYEAPVEAVYLLPLPSDAAVDTLELTVGDRTIEGWVMERDAARETYEDAKRDGKRAALLEQERDNLFTQHVAGICPDEHVTVTVQFSHQVEHEDGLYTLSLPLTVGERFSPPWVEDAERIRTPYARTGRTVDITVYLDEGLPVETLFSDSHDIEVAAEGPWGAMVGLAGGDDVPNRDFQLTWSLAGGAPRASVVAHKPHPDGPGYAAVTLEPQLVDDLFVARPRELLFVVDESCSMSGEPFTTARATVLLALDEMGPSDTFNLVKFSDAAGSLFDRPRPSDETTRAMARAWLSRFEGGGTQMDQGIVHSLTLPGDPEAMRLVLMLTDGFVGGEGTMFATVRRHLGDARLFSLGVGSSVNRYLLEGLAEMGRGDVSYHVPGRTPIDETVRAFYDRIAHPAMSDIEITWHGVDVFDAYPAKIPDLWAGQPIRVVARYEGGGDATVEVTGIVGTEPFRIEIPVSMPEVEPAHEGLASLWARRRIRDLEWYPRGRTPGEVQDEVTDLALEHHLVSKYTSLVAVDDEPCPCADLTLLTRPIPHEVPEGTLGGLGAWGSGYGGGGSGLGFGGLGTRGIGVGATAYGYGRGSGAIGAKSAEPIETASAVPIVLGALDRALIDDVVKRDLNAIRYCYERELTTQPDLAGRVEVAFTVAPDGSVRSASVKRSALGSPRVEQCITERFRRMTFPAPRGGGVVLVTYPFVFHVGSR